jgi:hypothetical protein
MKNKFALSIRSLEREAEEQGCTKGYCVIATFAYKRAAKRMDHFT